MSLFRPDQVSSLEHSVEMLADVFLAESDPYLWAGNKMPKADMDTKTRNDRYLDKRNAVTTGALLSTTIRLLAEYKNMPKDREDPEREELERQLADAAKRARKAVEKAKGDG